MHRCHNLTIALSCVEMQTNRRPSIIIQWRINLSIHSIYYRREVPGHWLDRSAWVEQTRKITQNSKRSVKQTKKLQQCWVTLNIRVSLAQINVSFNFTSLIRRQSIFETYLSWRMYTNQSAASLEDHTDDTSPVVSLMPCRCNMLTTWIWWHRHMWYALTTIHRRDLDSNVGSLFPY